MGSGRGPIKTEEYYSSNFEALGCLIEKEAVKLSKIHKNYILPAPHVSQVLDYISQIGALGQKCSDLLSAEGISAFQNIYSQGKFRILLIRHIITLFLYERVFDPFAFGISRELSDCLKHVDKDVMLRGSPTSKVLALIVQTVNSPMYYSYTKRTAGALGCMQQRLLDCVRKRFL